MSSYQVPVFLAELLHARPPSGYEAEAQAVGGACRHAMRGLEDCFTLNPKAPKAAVYAGWKEMDAYMRENKIEGVPSVLTPSLGAAATTAPKEEIITESATGSK